MKVLVACEESQTVTKAFRKLGHEAYSCDIQECSGGNPEWHLQQDVTELLNRDWDLIIAHPPCTDLCNSGARHFESKRADGRQVEAIHFFMQFLNADCDKVCVENPLGIIGGGEYIRTHFPREAIYYSLPIKHSQIIQPYMFGDPVSKSTALWLKGLPPLKPTNDVKDQVQWYTDPRGVRHCEWTTRQLVIDGKKYGYNTPQFKKHRSKTFQGIADAMAAQWGGVIAPCGAST